MNYAAFISIDPNERFGKPCIKNTRITVYDVLGWLAFGMEIKEILEDFPEISHKEILACLAFAIEKKIKFNNGFLN